MAADGIPALLAGIDTYVDARVRAAISEGRVQPTYGTITSVSPVGVRLDGETAVLEYAPPCLYAPTMGDRVWCLVWGTQIVIVGPVGGPTITSPAWELCSFYSPNGFAQSSGSDKAQERQNGDRYEFRGSFRRTAAGGGFGNGIFVGVPQSPQTQHVGIAQWQSGARCDLIIAAGTTEVVADITASSGTFGVGWVRVQHGAGYWTTPW